MIEVAPNLFVGNAIDWETGIRDRSTGDPKPGWRVVQACKEPYHRKALGYVSRGAPRDHAEYLWANRENRLILNMVDVEDARFFAPTMIDNALDYIGHMLAEGHKLLLHCNQGGSRAPGLALLYLHTRAGEFTGMTYQRAEEVFREDVYPNYQPAKGIRDYLISHWDDKHAVAA